MACRRIAFNARRDGEGVELRHDYIKIGETVAPDMETETNTAGEKRERYVTARRRLALQLHRISLK